MAFVPKRTLPDFPSAFKLVSYSVYSVLKMEEINSYETSVFFCQRNTCRNVPEDSVLQGSVWSACMLVNPLVLAWVFRFPGCQKTKLYRRKSRNYSEWSVYCVCVNITEFSDIAEYFKWWANAKFRTLDISEMLCSLFGIADCSQCSKHLKF
jgi:hypothetical protein